MAKRDIISEIRERQLRTNNLKQIAYSFRLNQLDKLIKSTEGEMSKNTELLRYIPVALIAIVESHFRTLYAIIIDHDVKYLANAVKFSKEQNLRFDPDFLVALHGKKATSGEIFAHLFQLNGLEDINKTLNSLLGIDFLDKIKDSDEPFDLEFEPDDDRFKKRYTRCFEALQKMFTLRHIVAHEFASNITLDKKEILSDYRLVKRLLKAATSFIEVTLAICIPPQQQLANIHMLQEADKMERKLDAAIDKLVNYNLAEWEFPLITHKEAFLGAIAKWKDFRESYADSFALFYEGGSFQSMAHSRIKIAQTQYFLQNLQDEFKTVFHDQNQGI
jgi:hypothetical protein